MINKKTKNLIIIITLLITVVGLIWLQIRNTRKEKRIEEEFSRQESSFEENITTNNNKSNNISENDNNNFEKTTYNPTPTIDFDAEYEEYLKLETDGSNKEDIFSEEEMVFQIRMADLRDELPIRNNLFDMNFNYLTGKFEVEMENESSDSLLKLRDWLFKNGYENIPLDNFEIK